jgi:hypothetical protein
MDDIERTASRSASGQLSSPAGYQHFTFENDSPSIRKEEGSSFSLVAEMDEIERTASRSASGQLSSPAGYQHFTFENDRPSIRKEEGSSSDSRAIE